MVKKKKKVFLCGSWSKKFKRHYDISSLANRLCLNVMFKFGNFGDLTLIKFTGLI